MSYFVSCHNLRARQMRNFQYATRALAGTSTLNAARQ